MGSPHRSPAFSRTIVLGLVICCFAAGPLAQEPNGAAGIPPAPETMPAEAGAVADGQEPAPPGETATAEEAPAGFFAALTAGVETAFNGINSVFASFLFYDMTFSVFDSPATAIDPETGSAVPLTEIDPDTGATVQVINEVQFPLIIFVLVFGGVFFTFRYSWVNVRLFGHSLDVVRGKYDHPDHEGEISHFKALTSALSATVGLGNIAGVAVAIGVGGPGAVLWMWVTAIFGMSMKFSSCTLAQVYRRVNPDGRVLGGPMVFISEGFKAINPALKIPGQLLAILFAVLTILAAAGGGNLFQTNQTYELFAEYILGGKDSAPGFAPWLFGSILAVLVGVVILGGIRRIGEVTSRLVPVMCLFYIAVCSIIVLLHITQLPGALLQIVAGAFSFEAGLGGFLGVVITGMQRAAFSNEAGLGSAAIAHAAAKTDEPVREGVVAMLGPSIDTIIVCTMTALTIIITDAYLDPAVADQGVAMTALALSELGGFMPILLFAAVAVFAFSTMISWGYYGERASEYLFGEGAIRPFQVFYVLVVIVGPVLTLEAVMLFADLMLLGMAFPNIVGMILLSGLVKRLADKYAEELRSGTMKPYK